MVKQKLPKTNEYWKKKLTSEQYAVLREKGTEAAFTGKYWDTKEKGMFHCAACGSQLFTSDAKFDSGTGWPSFDHALPGTVKLEDDTSCGMHRTEAICAHCGGHLGHVFLDGPKPSGLRFCINSCSLDLKKKKK